jgi:hypothetical protein
MPGTWSTAMRWTFQPELITDVIGDRAGCLEETKIRFVGVITVRYLDLPQTSARPI